MEINEKVMKRVEEHAAVVDKWCSENGYIRISTNAIGSWNYNLGEDGVSDVDTRSLIIAKFDTSVLALNQMESKTLKIDNEIATLWDIRFAFETYKKQCITSLEDFISPYKIVAKPFNHFMNVLDGKVEDFARFNGKRFLDAQLGYISSMYHRKDRGAKEAMHIYRVIAVLTRTKNGIPFKQAMDMTDDRKLLLNIKHDNLGCSASKICEDGYSWTVNIKDSYAELTRFSESENYAEILEKESNEMLVKLYKDVWGVR